MNRENPWWSIHLYPYLCHIEELPVPVLQEIPEHEPKVRFCSRVVGCLAVDRDYDVLVRPEHVRVDRILKGPSQDAFTSTRFAMNETRATVDGISPLEQELEKPHPDPVIVHVKLALDRSHQLSCVGHAHFVPPGRAFLFRGEQHEPVLFMSHYRSSGQPGSKSATSCQSELILQGNHQELVRHKWVRVPFKKITQPARKARPKPLGWPGQGIRVKKFYPDGVKTCPPE